LPAIQSQPKNKVKKFNKNVLKKLEKQSRHGDFILLPWEKLDGLLPVIILIGKSFFFFFLIFYTVRN